MSKPVATDWVKIYMSGPIEVAANVLRKVCMEQGLCVTLEPTRYIYTGGEEAGFVVGLINYPRYPVEPSELLPLALSIAWNIIDATHQWSFTLMTPTVTEYYSHRPEDPR